MPSRTSVIIPAFNEEQSIGLVLTALPKNQIHEIIVVDNNSSDDTVIEIENNYPNVILKKNKDRFFDT